MKFYFVIRNAVSTLHCSFSYRSHSFQGFSVELSEILVQSSYRQYKMCADRTGQNEQDPI